MLPFAEVAFSPLVPAQGSTNSLKFSRMSLQTTTEMVTKSDEALILGTSSTASGTRQGGFESAVLD